MSQTDELLRSIDGKIDRLLSIAETQYMVKQSDVTSDDLQRTGQEELIIKQIEDKKRLRSPKISSDANNGLKEE